jgi:outer membrane protein assembly factor BamA
VSISKRFLVEFQSDFAQVAPRLSGTLHVFLSGVDRARFHGFGNETDRLPESDYHRVTQYRFLVDPALTFSPISRVRFSFGPVLKITSTSVDPGRIVYDTLYGANLFGQVGVRTALQVDLRDHSVWTTRGLRLDVNANVYPAVLDVTEVFGELHGTVTTYVSIPTPTRPTLAIRLGGKKVWGCVPFHEAAYIGGESSLRGFELQRFAGDAAVYGSAELRLTLANIFFLFPTEFGVFGLADAGRVYVQGTSPGGWHTDGGGGIWLAPLRRA